MNQRKIIPRVQDYCFPLRQFCRLQAARAQGKKKNQERERKRDERMTHRLDCKPGEYRR
jgi:hypothetical protein